MEGGKVTTAKRWSVHTLHPGQLQSGRRDLPLLALPWAGYFPPHLHPSVPSNSIAPLRFHLENNHTTLNFLVIF